MIDYILCFVGGLTIGVIVGMFRMAFYYNKKINRFEIDFTLPDDYYGNKEYNE